MAKIYVDQSGKVEKSNEDTAIAASQGKSSIILIPTVVKRELENYLRRRKKITKSYYIKLFSLGVFLAARGIVRENDEIIIDIEMPGHEADIKFFLLAYLRRWFPLFKKEQVCFVLVGKKCRAHELAHAAYLNKSKDYRVVSLKEIVQLL